MTYKTDYSIYLFLPKNRPYLDYIYGERERENLGNIGKLIIIKM